LRSWANWPDLAEPAAARALHPHWLRAAPAAPGIGVWIRPQEALQILHTAHAEPSSLRELFLRQLATIQYRLSSSPKLLGAASRILPATLPSAATVAHAIMLRVRRVSDVCGPPALPEHYGRREGQIVPSTSKVSSLPKMVAVKNLRTDFGGRLPVPPASGCTTCECTHTNRQRAPHVLCVGTANDRSVTPTSHLCLPPRVDPRLKRHGHGQMIY
jgi:hypothetical protein